MRLLLAIGLLVTLVLVVAVQNRSLAMGAYIPRRAADSDCRELLRPGMYPDFATQHALANRQDQNLLCGMLDVHHSGGVLSLVGKRPSADEIANICSRNNGATCVWDAENELIAVAPMEPVMSHALHAILTHGYDFKEAIRLGLQTCAKSDPPPKARLLLK